MYIEIRTKGDGKIVKEVDLPYEDEGLTWVDVTREFGDALRGMGYRLPKDWDDFIQEQEKLDSNPTISISPFIGAWCKG